jgi:EpsD family peptidyl-prolyl cis-trans isomerase
VKKKSGLAVAALTIALLTSACDKKPGGQVVAVVNGEEITQQDLNAELGNVQIPSGADRNKILAQVLQRVIDRKLLVQRAKEQGLDKSPEYLSQLRRMQDELAISMLSSNAAKSIPLPDQAGIEGFITSHPAAFGERKRYTLDQISIPQSTDRTILKQLEPVHNIDQVASILTGAGVKFTRGPATFDSAMAPPELSQKIAALPPGEPFVVPVNGRFLVNAIKSVEPVPMSVDDAKPQALEMMRQQSLNDLIQKQLGEARTKAKILYQTGFEPPKGAPSGAAPALGTDAPGAAAVLPEATPAATPAPAATANSADAK